MEPTPSKFATPLLGATKENSAQRAFIRFALYKCPPVLLDEKAWDEKRIGMVCVDGSYFADMQANIDKLCTRQPKTCDYEEVRAGRAALRRVNRMLKVAAEHPELREYDFLRSMQFLEDYNE